MDNGKKNKLEINELYKKIAGADKAPESKNEVNAFIDENLSKEQAETVKSLLADEEKTKAILNSEAAKALFKKFFGGQGNG